MAQEAKTEPTKHQGREEIDFAAGDYLTFAAEESEDKKQMRWTLAFAVVAHAILLIPRKYSGWGLTVFSPMARSMFHLATWALNTSPL